MRISLILPSFALALLMVGQAHAQAYVMINNLSYPGTKIEVGNVIGIGIYNAAANSPVTYTCCEGGPWYHGDTDSGGNYSLATEELNQGHVATYEEHWYVNGTEVTPYNVSATDFPHAPNLPVFTVYSRIAANTNCTTGHASQRYHWTPVFYGTSTSLLSSTEVAAAAAEYSFFPHISFANAGTREDLAIFDGTVADPAIATNGTATATTLGSACINRMASTACLNSACVRGDWVLLSQITLDVTKITNLASTWSTPRSAMAYNILVHELGHVFRLLDVAEVGQCSGAQDIMQQSTSIRHACGVSSPNNSCVYNALDGLYGSVNPASCTSIPLSCYTGVSC